MTEKEWEDSWRELERQVASTHAKMESNRNRERLIDGVFKGVFNPYTFTILICIIVVLL